MKNGILLLGLFAISTISTAGPVKIEGIEHTLTIIQRPDGLFDVTCLDGSLEVKTKDDVLANRMCVHMRTYEGRWRLTNGAPGFCDMNATVVRTDGAIVKLGVSFVSPCPAAAFDSQTCDGLTCSVNMNGKFHSFDFTTGGQATVTRLEDGVAAVYRGNGGAGSGGGGGRGTARLEVLGGVPNILQNTIDNGVSWKSVCDDGFDAQDAAVACRELGFSGERQTFRTAIYAGGDRDYGWDDLGCRGDENALEECYHPAWGFHNCADGEHVQLSCDP